MKTHGAQLLETKREVNLAVGGLDIQLCFNLTLFGIDSSSSVAHQYLAYTLLQFMTWFCLDIAGISRLSSVMILQSDQLFFRQNFFFSFSNLTFRFSWLPGNFFRIR